MAPDGPSALFLLLPFGRLGHDHRVVVFARDGIEGKDHDAGEKDDPAQRQDATSNDDRMDGDDVEPGSRVQPSVRRLPALLCRAHGGALQRFRSSLRGAGGDDAKRSALDGRSRLR